MAAHNGPPGSGAWRAVPARAITTHVSQMSAVLYAINMHVPASMRAQVRCRLATGGEGK